MLKWPWLKLYRVKGESMRPAFKPGDLLLGSGLVKPKPESVAVVGREPLSIKRIKTITTEGVWLEGDNPPASTDSRDYGYVPVHKIKAVVFMRLF